MQGIQEELLIFSGVSKNKDIKKEDDFGVIPDFAVQTPSQESSLSNCSPTFMSPSAPRWIICVCLGVHGSTWVHVSVPVCVYVCAHTYGGQRTCYSGGIYLILKWCLSLIMYLLNGLELTSKLAGWLLSPRDPFVSAFPFLELEMQTTVLGFSLFFFFFKSCAQTQPPLISTTKDIFLSPQDSEFLHTIMRMATESLAKFVVFLSDWPAISIYLLIE